jgi:serine/threonine-protein kinase
MAAPDGRIGRSVAGKYVLDSLIGTGNMGSVYQARHKSLDACVAVKVMHEELAKDPIFAERFYREARAASRLDHPNVIRVLDFGTEPDGLLYIVMDRVEGLDLGQIMSRDFLFSAERIVDLLSQTLSAVAAAHAVGIVHRDLKPENVMVTTRLDDEGRSQEVVKVCDFGIAQMSEPAPTQPSSSRPLTLTGTLLGTPQYMAPEQCRGEVLDARADLYSIGVMLYELLAGQPPFIADNPIDLVVKHVSEDPTPPSRLRPAVSPELERVCLRAMAKRRNDRFADARAMRRALRSAVDAVESDSSVTPPRTRDLLAVAETQRAFSAENSRRARGVSRRNQDALRTLTIPPEKTPRGLASRLVIGAAAIVAVGVVFVVGWTRDAPVAATNSPASAHAAASDSSVPESADLPTKAVGGSASAAEPGGEPEPADHVALGAVGPMDRSATGASLRKVAHQSEPRLVARATSPAAVATPSESVVVASPAPSPAPVEPIAVPAQALVEPPARAPTSAAPVVSSVNKAPPSVDPAKGRVSYAVSAVGGGATAGSVSRALGRASSAWTECYRAGLRARSSKVEGKATLHLVCDDQGRVVEATMSGLGMPDVASCLQRSALGFDIPGADTGEAWSTVTLTFKVDD